MPEPPLFGGRAPMPVERAIETPAWTAAVASRVSQICEEGAAIGPELLARQARQGIQLGAQREGDALDRFPMVAMRSAPR